MEKRQTIISPEASLAEAPSVPCPENYGGDGESEDLFPGL